MYSALYTLPYIEVLSVVSMFVANKEIRLRLQVDLNGNSSALKSLKELLIPAWALLLARVRKLAHGQHTDEPAPCSPDKNPSKRHEISNSKPQTLLNPEPS